MRIDMDALSKFLVDTFQPTPKVAAKTVPIVEPNILEKRAYGMALDAACHDSDFLSKFEGTPLAPQAVALAEQELAMEQRQLQRRMQRAAERKMDDNWDQDCIEQDQIRLQKQQLLLELYKMKAMTPAAQPGDAAIGAPQAAPQLGADIGGGAEGGAPVQEPAPVQKMSTLAQLIEKKAAQLEDVLHIPHGATHDEQMHNDVLELAGHPGLPHEARKAILEKYIQHRAAAPLMSHEQMLEHQRQSNRGTGAGLGLLGGMPIGAGLGALAGHMIGREPVLGGVIGGGAGMIGGALLGSHLGGKRPLNPAAATAALEAAKQHQGIYQPLLADETTKERLLGSLQAQHYKNQLEALQAHMDSGDYDSALEDQWDSGRKKKATMEFARKLRGTP